MNATPDPSDRGRARRPDEIVGYTYQGEVYCPCCIREDFLRVFEPASQVGTTEVLLDVAAEAQGIDRRDKSSFDSSVFPHVVRRSYLETDPIHPRTFERCTSCGDKLVDR